MTDFVANSIRLIRKSQASTGAYPAALAYDTYQDCWFRDGSYIAHAMDLSGHPDSASRFHDWVAAVILRRADTIQRAVRADRQGNIPPEAPGLLHTRYTLDGDESSTDWPNFQLDGLGTWLWSLEEHVDTTASEPPAEWADAAELVSQYLTVLWDRPCYDCWEEFPDKVHPHTLAAIHGGLSADQRLFQRDHSQVLEAIGGVLLNDAVADGHFVKYLGTEDVDSSLIGLATPYQVVEPDHSAFLSTVKLIESSLRVDGGGPHRYADDSFYGGGEWVVLAGWLGWHLVQGGDTQRARQLCEWIEAQADPEGNLPEQVPMHLNHAKEHQVWVERWGPVAQPLLWSHANYLILHHHLNEASAR